MKHLPILFSFFIFSLPAVAQTTQATQVLNFEKTSWSISPPAGFTLIDSSRHTSVLNPDVEVRRKQLFFKKEGNNVFLFSISTSTQKGMDWKNTYKKENKHFYEQVSLQKPSLKFDTTLSTVMIDTQLFNKFTMTGKENGQVTYNHVHLDNFLNGYRIKITYSYTNDEALTEIETALKTIKLIY